jgi:uncharacterized protein YkvS
MNPDAITVADKGNIVEFDRHNMVLQGKVITILDNSVVVDLQCMDNFEDLGLEHHRTVVSHKKYTIVG